VSPEEAVTAVIDALNAQRVHYMLVGSLSCVYYGSARLSANVDVVVQFEDGQLSALMTQLGPGFRLSLQTTSGSATATQRYLIEPADKSYLVELFLLSEDPHDVAQFSRRRRVRFLQRDVFLPTVEDTIITKLSWFLVGRRHRDIQDTRDIIAVQNDRVDWDYVYSWSDRHGTRELLDQVRESLRTN
jgi:hypothetical protein